MLESTSSLTGIYRETIVWLLALTVKPEPRLSPLQVATFSDSAQALLGTPLQNSNNVCLEASTGMLLGAYGWGASLLGLCEHGLWRSLD